MQIASPFLLLFDILKFSSCQLTILILLVSKACAISFLSSFLDVGIIAIANSLVSVSIIKVLKIFSGEIPSF